jgi:isopentenyl diphosphate isomerase/L-lactate dehydrogenase-like FMN-dependent dehydrogenase
VDGHAATHLGSIAWLRDLWGGPFMLKGVMRVDDAKRAVDVGVSAISVSNHGGDNPDGTRRRMDRPASRTCATSCVGASTPR